LSGLVETFGQWQAGAGDLGGAKLEGD